MNPFAAFWVLSTTTRAESICSLLCSTGLSIPSMLPDLEAAADRVKGTDYYMHKELTGLMERGNSN